MNKHIATSLRILTGLFFIVSAILKIRSIDSFEVYIYSFDLLSLSTAFLFSRVVIGFELLLGLLFLLNVFMKQVVMATIAMMLGFIVFLVYLIFSNNPESCHCFGDSLELSHPTSIAKNILIIGLVLVVLKYNTPFSFRFKKIATVLAFVISFSIPFIVSPPDTMNFSLYAKKTSFNEKALQDYLETKGPLKGKQIISFYGTGCRFCKLSSKKLTVIANKAGEKQTAFSIVFWGNDKSIKKFFTVTNSKKLPYEIMDVSQFLKITNGQMPLIILLEDGIVKKKYGYRDLNEEEVLDFLDVK